MRKILRAAVIAVSLLAVAPAWAERLPEGRPGDLGFAQDRLDRLTRAMERDIADSGRAGAVVAIARGGSVVYERAFGFADIAAREKMRTDHIFRIYSQTKPIVSVGLLMLMEEGHFALSDPLAKHVPELADLKVQDRVDGQGNIRLKAPARQPTMHDVMRHTSGWTGTILQSFDDPVSRMLAKRETARPGNLKQLVASLATEPLAYEPGTEWRYGPEHDVQAYLIEKFSGMKLEDFLRERLFAPLAMKDTHFNLPPDRLDRYTMMYQRTAEGTLRVFDPKNGASYLREALDPRGGSLLSSTAADELRFGQMLLNGGELDGKRVLGRKTVDLMLMNHLSSAVPGVGFDPKRIRPGEGYGLGIGVFTDVAASGLIGSKGVAYWPGFGTTVMYVDPDEDIVVVALSQHYPSDMAWLERVRSLAYQALVD